jgi:hypothetical protein
VQAGLAGGTISHTLGKYIDNPDFGDSVGGACDVQLNQRVQIGAYIAGSVKLQVFRTSERLKQVSSYYSISHNVMSMGKTFLTFAGLQRSKT